MRKLFWFMFILIAFVVFLFIKTKDSPVDDKVDYDGKHLNIAVVGTLPDLINDKVSVGKIELNVLLEQERELMETFDAIMMTPEEFEDASNDKFINFYKKSSIPIIFFGADKGHWTFINEGITYDSSKYDTLKDGSHTTMYLSDFENNREDYWKFHLEGGTNLNSIYKEIFKTIELISIQNESKL